jgi:hypothetical protein
MRKVITLLSVVILLFALCPMSTVQAADPIISIDEVEPGMVGVAKTTIQGTDISQFDVEVIAVLNDVLYGGADAIMMKVSGDVINETGGIVSGMSGSPVYIEDKVAGAIAYVYYADPTIGLVTGIEDMLKTSDKEENASETKEMILTKPMKIGDRTVSKVIIAPNQKQASEFTASADMAFSPLPITLCHSGISSPEALQELKEFAEEYNFQLVEAGEYEVFVSKEETPALEPGAPLGVGIMLGDIILGGLGTATYIDGDEVWAFGHPMYWWGEVNLPMTAGYIYTTLPSSPGIIGFKEGTLTETVGTLSQDRGACVYGHLGDGPTMIPVTATASDKDLGVNCTLQASCAPMDEFAWFGYYPAVMAIYNAMDRVGEGTSRVIASVDATTLDGPVVREDMFYSFYDISYPSIYPLRNAISLLVYNEFRPVEITDINFEAEIEQTRQTAEIQNAEWVSMGQTGVLVEITPWHTEEAEMIFVPISLPEDMSGEATIVVTYGRPWYSLGDTLEETIANFENADHYNELVVEFYPPEGEMIKSEVTTDRLLRGYISFTVQIS